MTPARAWWACLLVAACTPEVINSVHPPAPDGGRPAADAASAPDAGFSFTPPDADPHDVPAPTTGAPVPSVGPWGGQTIDPALPPDAPKMFNGHDIANAAPVVVY